MSATHLHDRDAYGAYRARKIRSQSAAELGRIEIQADSPINVGYPRDPRKLQVFLTLEDDVDKKLFSRASESSRHQWVRFSAAAGAVIQPALSASRRLTPTEHARADFCLRKMEEIVNVWWYAWWDAGCEDLVGDLHLKGM